MNKIKALEQQIAEKNATIADLEYKLKRCRSRLIGRGDDISICLDKISELENKLDIPKEDRFIL